MKSVYQSVYQKSTVVVVALSDVKLKKILQGKGDYEGDSELPDGHGLSVRVSRKRKISFQYRYRIKDISANKLKPKRVKLGNYPAMSIKDARKQLIKCKELLERGIDPAVQKRVDKAKNQSAVYINTCIDHFIERYVRFKRKNPLEIEQLFNNHVRPYIGQLPAKDVELAHWLPIFDALVDRGHAVQAGNVLVKSKQMLKFCKQRGMINTNVLADVVVNDVGSKSEKGERVLSDLEIGKLWRLLDNMPSRSKMSVAMVEAARLLLIFGCRSTELRLSRIEEWDFDKMVWTVPKHNTKHKSEVVRPIPVKALPYIDTVIKYSKNGILFPPVKSISKSEFVSRQSFTKLPDYLNEYINIDEFDAHDLRRTFTTKLSELNVEPYLVEMLLGHKLGGVFETYNKHSFIDQKLDALDKWLDRLELLAQGDNNVLILPSAVG